MIYIQTSNGLSQVSPTITKDKIIAALGYAPAPENTTFFEDESGALLVADENGNIIAKIDENGLTTTHINTTSCSINGEDLETKLQNLINSIPEVDLTSYATKKELNEAIENINIPSDENCATHIADTSIHITPEERKLWNTQSTFSGRYSELIDAPAIHPEEEDNRLTISDADGNVIMEIADTGVNVASLSINGVSLSLNEALRGKKLSILGDSISTFEGYNPDGYRTRYPENDVTDVKSTWWQQVLDNTDMILGINDSYAGSTVQSDINTGSSAVLDSRIKSLGNNGDPDIILVMMGANDALNDDLTVENTVNTSFTTPLTSYTLDDTTFIGGYQTMITKLMMEYPNAKIICCSILWSNNSSTQEIHNASTLIAEICELYGCEYINIRKCGITPVNMSTYLYDGIHPNAAGHALMAQYITKQL